MKPDDSARHEWPRLRHPRYRFPRRAVPHAKALAEAKEGHKDLAARLNFSGKKNAPTRRATSQTSPHERRVRQHEDRPIAPYVSSLGTPSWWTQTITAGDERIRGLRERGQQRSGEYQITKSRTVCAFSS